MLVFAKPDEVRDMAAGDQHPSVVQERVPCTEQVVADMGQDGDCLRDRVPHPLDLVAAEYQDLAVGHHDIVYGRLGKTLQFRPLAGDAGLRVLHLRHAVAIGGRRRWHAVPRSLAPSAAHWRAPSAAHYPRSLAPSGGALAGAVCGTLPPLDGSAACGAPPQPPARRLPKPACIERAIAGT